MVLGGFRWFHVLVTTKYRYNEDNPSVYTDDSFTELFQF